MSGDFDSVRNQLKEVKTYLHFGGVKTDTLVFRLHYVVRSVVLQTLLVLVTNSIFNSFVIFVAYSLITTIATYAGDPIDCQTLREGFDMDFYDE